MSLDPAQWDSVAELQSAVAPAHPHRVHTHRVHTPLEAAAWSVFQKYTRLREADEQLTELTKKPFVDLDEIRKSRRAITAATIDLHAAMMWLEDVLPPKDDSDVPDPASGVQS